jgi:hypothetical protein
LAGTSIVRHDFARAKRVPEGSARRRTHPLLLYLR